MGFNPNRPYFVFRATEEGCRPGVYQGNFDAAGVAAFFKQYALDGQQIDVMVLNHLGNLEDAVTWDEQGLWGYSSSGNLYDQVAHAIELAKLGK